MSLYLSMAPAIEDMVIEKIYEKVASLLKYDGQAQANWMVALVQQRCVDQDVNTPVTPGYITGLLWEQIEAGKINIDKYGMLTLARAAE
jgi:hypothetical protein